MRAFFLLMLFSTKLWAGISESQVQQWLPGMDNYLKNGRYLTFGNCIDISNIDDPIQKKNLDTLHPSNGSSLQQGLRYWIGLNLQACRYKLKHANGVATSSFVIMANPNKHQLTHWLIKACDYALGLPVYAKLSEQKCITKLYRQMQVFSSVQLPVFGDVLENIDVASDPERRRRERGFFKHFCFRNGVTVIVKDNEDYNGSVDDPREQGLHRCLENEVVIMRTGRARLVGTLPSHLENYLNKPANSLLDPNIWMNTTAEIIKKSITKPEQGNVLLNAWVASNVGQGVLLY